MKSEKLPKREEYPKKLRKLLNSNIVDILVFGSLTKGGDAKDVDIAIVTKNEEDVETIDSAKKEIKQLFKNPDIQIIDISSIYSPLWLTLIKEGFSVKQNQYIHEIYKIKPSTLYKYSLNKLNNTQKVQFERGIKKIVADGGKFLTRSVVLIPITKKNEMMDFLKYWNVYYESQEYELLPLMRKEGFL